MKTTFNIENVISARFRLQTVQKNFYQKYKIMSPSVDKFKSQEFLNNFNTWSPENQKSLLIELGGPANYKFTRYWINRLIKNLNKNSTNKYQDKL